jgi:hypothetical protein
MAFGARHNRIWLYISSVLLLTLLSLQIVLAKRDTLAVYPEWRPLLSQLCLIASCRLEAWRQPEAFVPVAQSVAADRRQSGVLRVSLSFRNDAQWPQPWPQIEIRLNDVNGDALGMRRFTPEEYLNNGSSPDIKPGQTVSVEIALQETSGKAADFAIEFH